MPDVHPNGPRNFATLLRDGVPLPQEMLEWITAADTGHSTLTQLRSSLGLDLSLSAANDAARAIWPARGTPPTKEDAARVIDVMYGAITSSRLVHVEIVEDGLRASRPDGPIVMRDGRLELWLFAENKTTNRVRISAADHALDVEPGRTGSILLDAGLMRPGSQKVPITIVSVGSSALVELPVECHQTGTLRVSMIDEATKQLVAARVYLRDDLGPTWPSGATARRDFHGNVFFHAEGTFDVQISGRAHLRVVRGIEYESTEREVSVGAGAKVETSVQLRRWSHKSADGWYSGDVHVHLHYGGEYLLAPADAALVQRAEDVHFMNMMVANQGSGWVHDAENFTGANHPLSENDHILRWGEEYRNNFYGHMCMFGIRELVPPIYSGFPNSEQSYDLPANAEAATHCHKVGGTLSYAHPMFESIDLDRVFAPEHRLSVEAKELPVDAALGHIDAVDVLAYPANTAESCKLWYRLLNCGLRLAATAGTDTFMNFCDQGVFSNPPAGDRVFVRVDGRFTTESWCEAVRAGRTFVTNGPMLSLDVEGHVVGDEIGAQSGQVLRVEGVATSAVPIARLDLIVNGDVVASAEAGDGGRQAFISHDLHLGGSCWIALRCSGPKNEAVLDPDGAFAHTSPVYIAVAEAPLARHADAAYFIEWIERLIATTESRARFPSDAARDAVIAVFREGQAYYRTLA